MSNEPSVPKLLSFKTFSLVLVLTGFDYNFPSRFLRGQGGGLDFFFLIIFLLPPFLSFRNSNYTDIKLLEVASQFCSFFKSMSVSFLIVYDIKFTNLFFLMFNRTFPTEVKKGDILPLCFSSHTIYSFPGLISAIFLISFCLPVMLLLKMPPSTVLKCSLVSLSSRRLWSAL